MAPGVASRGLSPHSWRGATALPTHTSDAAMVGRHASLGFQKFLKPRNTLYTSPSEPTPSDAADLLSACHPCLAKGRAACGRAPPSDAVERTQVAGALVSGPTSYFVSRSKQWARSWHRVLAQRALLTSLPPSLTHSLTHSLTNLALKSSLAGGRVCC